MKYTISLAYLLLFSIALHSQTDIKISEKKNNLKFKYTFLPENPGFEGYRSATMLASDGFGKEYAVLDNLSKPTDKQIQMGTNYFQQVSLKADGEFKITVTRLNHSQMGKEVMIKDESVKKPDGTVVNEKRYNYKMNFTDTYKIVVKDGKNGDKVILEKELVVSDYSTFPSDYQGGAVGYPSEKNLILAYDNAINESVELKVAKGHILQLKENYASLFYGLKNQIKDFLQRAIMSENSAFIVYNSSYKTKEERFALLDSAGIYFYNGMDLMNENAKLDNFINFHDKAVIENFSNAYRIYKLYLGDDYLAMLSAKDKDEYISAMTVNLFYAALLSANFEEATAIYEKVGKEANIDIEKKNADLNSKKLSDQLSGGFGQLSRTQAQKDFDRMDLLFEMFKHELKTYGAHKEFYNFYK